MLSGEVVRLGVPGAGLYLQSEVQSHVALYWASSEQPVPEMPTPQGENLHMLPQSTPRPGGLQGMRTIWQDYSHGGHEGQSRLPPASASLGWRQSPVTLTPTSYYSQLRAKSASSPTWGLAVCLGLTHFSTSPGPFNSHSWALKVFRQLPPKCLFIPGAG